jgi:hypothetical protein
MRVDGNQCAQAWVQYTCTSPAAHVGGQMCTCKRSARDGRQEGVRGAHAKIMFMTATMDTAAAPECTSSVEAVASGAMKSLMTTTTSANSCAAVPRLRNQPMSASDFTCRGGSFADCISRKAGRAHAICTLPRCCWSNVQVAEGCARCNGMVGFLVGSSCGLAAAQTRQKRCLDWQAERQMYHI